MIVASKANFSSRQQLITITSRSTIYVVFLYLCFWINVQINRFFHSKAKRRKKSRLEIFYTENYCLWIAKRNKIHLFARFCQKKSKNSNDKNFRHLAIVDFSSSPERCLQFKSINKSHTFPCQDKVRRTETTIFASLQGFCAAMSIDWNGSA